ATAVAELQLDGQNGATAHHLGRIIKQAQVVTRNHRHLANVVSTQFWKPQAAVWPQSDSNGEAVGGGDRKLRDRSSGGDLSDLVGAGICKPQISVWPCGDSPGSAAGGGDRKLRDRSGGGDSSDLVS